mmetsp:Transcript_54150/g.82054  ORF Transcript_54150/g.82054 Transcript_54150/m.82054 type:complete len:85 (-) Transcript_54150:2-256(-)
MNKNKIKPAKTAQQKYQSTFRLQPEPQNVFSYQIISRKTTRDRCQKPLSMKSQNEVIANELLVQTNKMLNAVLPLFSLPIVTDV